MRSYIVLHGQGVELVLRHLVGIRLRHGVEGPLGLLAHVFVAHLTQLDAVSDLLVGQHVLVTRQICARHPDGRLATLRLRFGRIHLRLLFGAVGQSLLVRQVKVACAQGAEKPSYGISLFGVACAQGAEEPSQFIG